MKNYSSKLKKLLDIISHNWMQKVICVVLALIIVQLYSGSLLEKRYFSVHIEYKYPDALTASSSLPRSIRVSLWGNTSIINSIRDEDITALVDTSHIKMEGEYRVPIQFIKNNPILVGESLEMHAEPSEVKLKMEQKIQKTIEVKLEQEGSPLEDYGIGEVFIEPNKVSIEGPRSRVEKIEKINTDIVQVEGRKSDVEGNVALVNNDPHISIVGQSNIKYKIEIKEKEFKKTIDNITIYIKNFDRSSLRIVESYIPKGELIIRGNRQTVDSFSPSRVRDLLYVDLKNIDLENIPNEGATYNFNVQAARLPSLNVESIKPEKITLLIKKIIKEDE